MTTRHYRVKFSEHHGSGLQCAGFGEWNSTTVDESAGHRQRYVDDCQVCCKANMLRIEYDASAHEFVISAMLE
jgi:hypothetical protein